MTENLLQKLEEKVMQLLAELEGMRKEMQRVNQENAAFKMERENHGKKLQDLIEMLDSLHTAEVPHLNASNAGFKPMLVEEIA